MSCWVRWIQRAIGLAKHSPAIYRVARLSQHAEVVEDAQHGTAGPNTQQCTATEQQTACVPPRTAILHACLLLLNMSRRACSCHFWKFSHNSTPNVSYHDLCSAHKQLCSVLSDKVWMLEHIKAVAQLPCKQPWCWRPVSAGRRTLSKTQSCCCSLRGELACSCWYAALLSMSTQKAIYNGHHHC